MTFPKINGMGSIKVDKFEPVEQELNKSPCNNRRCPKVRCNLHEKWHKHTQTLPGLHNESMWMTWCKFCQDADRILTKDANSDRNLQCSNDLRGQCESQHLTLVRAVILVRAIQCVKLYGSERMTFGVKKMTGNLGGVHNMAIVWKLVNTPIFSTFYFHLSSTWTNKTFGHRSGKKKLKLYKSRMNSWIQNEFVRLSYGIHVLCS